MPEGPGGNSHGLPGNMSGNFHDVRGMSQTQTHDLQYFTTPTRCFRYLTAKEELENYKYVKRKSGRRRA